jgi:glycosyltransferase involved in cell wall biosynthesis
MNVANGFFLPVLKARGIPTVVNVDGLEWERDKWGTAAKKMFLQGARQTAKHADALVFDAERIGDYWRDNFDRDGTFIPYGGTAPTSTRLPDGLQHRDYVLCVARFVPENTMTEFLQAVPLLAKQTNVVIVGSSGTGGPYDDWARRLDAEHSRVTWMGHLSDDHLLHSLWAHAGVYFHGHSVGGTNPALVQAMACGAPIVARESQFNREVLGASGRFAPPEPQAIVKEVAAVLNKPAVQQTLSEAARKRAETSYNWPDVLRSYADCLENAVGGKRSNTEQVAVRD